MSLNICLKSQLDDRLCRKCADCAKKRTKGKVLVKCGYMIKSHHEKGKGGKKNVGN